MVVPVAGQGVYCETSGAWFHLWWCRTPGAGFTVKPRVRGFIYDGAGRPAWAFGHRSPFSQICSPRFFLFFNDIGHSRGFHKNCSPWLVNTLGTAGIFQEKVPNSFGKHGEHFVEICCLYPNRPRSRKIRGEQFFISTSLCPKPVNPWGTIPVKLAPVPKPALHRPGSQPKPALHRHGSQPKPGYASPGISPPVHVTPGHPPNHLLRKRFLPVRLRKIPPQICLTFSPSSSALKTDSTG